ncbi:MAG: SDR family oxidoreductase [Tepidisphaeraceae bacterium]
MSENEGQKRVALVTGGSRRVGRAIVERLAGAGFLVLFASRPRPGDTDDAAANDVAEADGVFRIPADLIDPGPAAQRIHDDVARRAGRLDVLVNNASAYEPSGLHATSTEQMSRLFAIHAQAPLLLCRAFEPMLRASRGHVVNMVDLLAERPWPEYLAYCASKAALANLTLGLARALAPEVTVNGIAPGVVEWPEDYPRAERERYLKRVPLGRAGSPQDVANLVHFLVTEGSYITGQIIRLDGGRSIT